VVVVFFAHFWSSSCSTFICTDHFLPVTTQRFVLYHLELLTKDSLFSSASCRKDTQPILMFSILPRFIFLLHACTSYLQGQMGVCGWLGPFLDSPLCAASACNTLLYSRRLS
jgi:hypothetical protein